MPATDSTTAIEVVYRLESPRVVAVLAVVTGDIALAEELAQDALVDALRQWPRDGIPHSPGAWLTTVGSGKASAHFGAKPHGGPRTPRSDASYRPMQLSTETKRRSARCRARRSTTTASA